MTARRVFVLVALVAIASSVLAVGAASAQDSVGGGDGVVVEENRTTADEFEETAGPGDGYRIVENGADSYIAFGDGESDSFDDLNDWTVSGNVSLSSEYASEGSNSVELAYGGEMTRDMQNLEHGVSFDVYNTNQYRGWTLYLSNSSGNVIEVGVDSLSSNSINAGSPGSTSSAFSLEAGSWYTLTVEEINVHDGTFTLTAYDSSGTLVDHYNASFDASGVSSLDEISMSTGSYTFDAVYFDSVESGTQLAGGPGTYHSRFGTSEPELLYYDVQAPIRGQGAQPRFRYGNLSWNPTETDIPGPGSYAMDVSGMEFPGLIHTGIEIGSGSDYLIELHELGATWQSSVPEISGVSPQTGDDLSEDITLEADVSDADFDSHADNELDVEVTLNGDVIHSETLDSDGTVSVDASGDVVGGTNDWSISVSDPWGNDVETSHSFEVPDELHIRDEADNSLIDNADVTVTFYSTGNVVERTTSNGTIDLTGLPKDEFIVQAESEGYLTRSTVIRSIYQQESVYLRDESEEFVETSFTMDDYTGQWPQEDTVLLAQRPINEEWKTVEGDFFGASGEMTAQLEYNVRHQLILMNMETGQQRDLGTITPTTSRTRNLEVLGDGDIVLDEPDASISVGPSTRSLAATDSSSVSITVDDRGNALEFWSVLITYTNGSETEVLHDEIGGPDGVELAPTFNLSDRDGGTVHVTVQAETESGVLLSETVQFRVSENFDHDYSLISILNRSAYTVGDDGPSGGATTFLGIIVSVLAAGLVGSTMRVSTEVIGGVALASLSLFVSLGWIPVTLLFACGVTFVAMFLFRRGGF